MSPAPRPDGGPAAAILTFGCKVNQVESAALAGELLAAGYAAAPAAEADILIVNTCAVTAAAGLEAARLLRRLRRRKPEALIVATGCLAQLEPEALAATGADLIVGQADKASLVGLLAGLGPGRPDDGHENLSRVVVSAHQGTIRDLGRPEPARTRAFLRIQDGCGAGCAYCAVPLARGVSRSSPPERVVEDLASYLARGFREIVLTGIHLGHWGLDLDPPSNLSALLDLVEARLGSFFAGARLRLSSLEPLEVPLVAKRLAGGSFLAPHLHAPLQSGSDAVLTAMGRPYRAGRAAEILSDLKRAAPDLNLGTDILCGFPGETGADFQATVDLVESLPLGRIHVFPFSARKGTRAADLPGRLPEPLVRERAAAIRALAREKGAAFLAGQLQRPREALVEAARGPSERPTILTDNYLRALLPQGTPVRSGEMVEVVLVGPGSSPGLAEAVLAGRPERLPS